VVGTVRGDLHDIGKNLVAMMLEGAGFEVVDLGNDVPPERFVEAAVSRGAGIIGMSALLTTTMFAMKDTIDLLAQRQLKGKVMTMVGGAPVTAAFAREIGADGYGDDAATAVDIAKKFVGA
jgi:5-methyltetrahydrofolate--homocysteine methyltransferase